MVALQEAAIRLGQVLLPIGTTIAQTFTAAAAPIAALLVPIAGLVDALAQVPGLITAVTIAFLGWAALKFIPPLLIAIGRGFLALGFKKLAVNAAHLAITTFPNLAKSLAGVSASLGPVGIALAIVTGGLIALDNAFDAARARRMQRYVATIEQFGITSDRATAAVDGITEAVQRQQGALIGGRRIPIADSRVQDAVDAELASLSDLHAANKIRAKDNEEIVADLQGISRLSGITDFTELTGQGMRQFTRDLRGGLVQGRTDLGKWNQFVNDQLDDAADAFADFAEEATGNLNFAADAFTTMASEAQSATETLAGDLSDVGAEELAELRDAADLTFQEIIGGLREARQESADFGRNLPRS